MEKNSYILEIELALGNFDGETKALFSQTVHFRDESTDPLEIARKAFPAIREIIERAITGGREES